MKTKKDGRINNGGHKNSGRKDENDLAIPVTCYIKESRVNELGGIEVARSISKEYLNSVKFVSNTVRRFDGIEK